jgi:hypothetical protein
MASGDSQGTQRCGKCHQHKPLEAFSRNQANPLGRNYRCKECEASRVREAVRKHRQANRSRPAPEHPPGTLLRCWKCRQELPFEQFGIDRGASSGRASICKQCRRSRNASRCGRCGQALPGPS